MKKLISHYFIEENVCLFSLKDQVGLEYSEVVEDKHIKINIETKEVQKVQTSLHVL